MIMEKRDLYDVNKVLTGKIIFKGEEIPHNNYILVVLAFIQNSKGQFLIQKRSTLKDGKYGSTGGHPKSGETSLQGIVTEIKEELGLTVFSDEMELIFSGKADFEQVFFDIYYMKKDIDISNLVLQKEEVESVKWLSIEEVLQLIDDGLFLKSHAEDFFRMINIFKKRGVELD